jgi:hypothetical protein
MLVGLNTGQFFFEVLSIWPQQVRRLVSETVQRQGVRGSPEEESQDALYVYR